ncbi:MAG: glycosyltransferase [Coriobacteriia bacterium]|nr:glycosyltransferase [Coriobacteriia bacterium]
MVVAVCDEGRCVERLVDSAESVLGHLECDFELLAVDDGSSDNTRAILEDLASSRPWLKVIALGSRSGKGRALREGFERAQYGTLAFADADLEVPLSELPALLKRAGDRRIVVGVRADRRPRPVRRVLSAGYRMLVRVLLGIDASDVGCPLKVFPADLVRRSRPVTDGWVIDAELLAAAMDLGYEIEEVPVSWAARLNGVSRVRPVRAAVGSVAGLLRIALRRRKERSVD